MTKALGGVCVLDWPHQLPYGRWLDELLDASARNNSYTLDINNNLLRGVDSMGSKKTSVYH